jgi:hypothetical protein
MGEKYKKTHNNNYNNNNNNNNFCHGNRMKIFTRISIAILNVSHLLFMDVFLQTVPSL